MMQYAQITHVVGCDGETISLHYCEVFAEKQKHNTLLPERLSEPFYISAVLTLHHSVLV